MELTFVRFFFSPGEQRWHQWQLTPLAHPLLCINAQGLHFPKWCPAEPTVGQISEHRAGIPGGARTPGKESGAAQVGGRGGTVGAAELGGGRTGAAVLGGGGTASPAPLGGGSACNGDGEEGGGGGNAVASTNSAIEAAAGGACAGGGTSDLEMAATSFALAPQSKTKRAIAKA